MSMNREELTKKMKKELKSQHIVSMVLIIFGSLAILGFSLIMYFAYEQQTIIDVCMFPVGLMMGVVAILLGLFIWNGPLFGLSIREEYEKKMNKLLEGEKNENI